MENINVGLPEEMYGALFHRAEKDKVRISDVVRAALAKYLKVSGDVAPPGRPWRNGVAKEEK